MSSSLEAILKPSGKTSLEALKSAYELSLQNGGLTSVPESIGHLTNLTWLDLCWNRLSSLPESIGQLTNLEYLYIYNNPITELPESFTRLTNLSRLFMEEEGNMTIQLAPIGITALPCYSNNEKPWSGMTMTFSRALKKLKLYKYDNENLTDISSLIGKWKACDRINISNNKISTLPDQLSTLTGLRNFNISNNRISTLPDQLSTLTELCDFNIANNMFAMFPDVLLKMSWLTSLNIAGNSFIELPEGITKLAKLASLVIKDSNGKITIQHAPANISTLPCYNANADLKKLTPPVQLPIVEFPPELQQFVLPVAPIFNKTKEDTLGKGGQATVYKGTFQGKPVAIKDIQTDAESMKYAADEVILTKKIPHQNVVNIIGVYLSAQGMLIVMELGSDSLKGLIDKKNGPLTPREIVTFGKQIADALSHCVTQNPKEPIHHRDLKTENVLIVNGQAKLTDFGLAHTRQRVGPSHVSVTKSGRGEDGTKHWQGPEISNTACKENWDAENYGQNVGHRGEKSDVFAFGLILWSMATGKYPFVDKPSEQIPPLLLNGDRPEIPADVHPTLAHIIRACWRQNYKKRPQFGDIAAVLTKCGAGNLDAVSKDTLDHLVPIRYSLVDEMHTGELYQYLIEEGISQELALKIRQKPMTGELFATYNFQKFVATFSASEADAQKLVSLQKLASNSSSASKTESTPPQTPISPSVISKVASVTVASPPQSTRTTAPMQTQPPAAGRPIPPKPIVEMGTDELVTYLRGQKGILDSFLNDLQQDEVTGEVFWHILDSETLAEPPFNMKPLQLRATLKAIEEIKLL